MSINHAANDALAPSAGGCPAQPARPDGRGATYAMETAADN
ncbi:MAG: hypothetical protein ABSH34_23670 [Verrucomicrobiota bacterium]